MPEKYVIMNNYCLKEQVGGGRWAFLLKAYPPDRDGNNEYHSISMSYDKMFFTRRMGDGTS